MDAQDAMEMLLDLLMTWLHLRTVLDLKEAFGKVILLYWN